MEPITADKPPSQPTVFPRRIRMRYAREGAVRFLSHLDLVKVIERALRRTAIKAAYTEGFHPRLRLAFASALPVGAESDDEWMDLDLYREDPTSAEQVKEAFNSTLPAGLVIKDAREISFPCKSLGGIIGMSVWHLSGPCLHDAGQKIDAVMAADKLLVIRRSQRRDIRPCIERLEADGTILRAWIRIEPTGSVKPDELLTAMGYSPEERVQVRSRREALLWNSPAGWAEPWGETVM